MELKLSRTLQRLRQELLTRRLPHGLVSLAYLLPSKDDRVRLHRQLWWQSRPRWPRFLWLVLEVWLWLRWIVWFAVPACWRVFQRMGANVTATERIQLTVHGLRILKLALHWCIPPGESYRLGLYRDPDSALDYAYPQETQAFHAWRNAPLGNPGEAMALLEDKTLLAEVLSSRGIPAVSSLAVVPAGAGVSALQTNVAAHGKLFCKANSGAQGRGAFAAWATGAGLAGHTLEGKRLPDSNAVEAAWRKLCRADSVLIQPYLSNHPALVGLVADGEAITLRLITEMVPAGMGQQGQGISCLYAALEVPLERRINSLVRYIVLPVSPADGVIGAAETPVFAGDDPLLAQGRQVESLSLAIGQLPAWSEVLSHSILAHRQFAQLRAIAWDWVITPSGPMLLEGNPGFGLGFQNPTCRLIARTFLSDNLDSDKGTSCDQGQING